MTEPTDQPSAVPHASPAGATRREARLRREGRAAQPAPGPLLAAPLTVPQAQPGAPLPTSPAPPALPATAPIEPATTVTAPVAPRRRTALWASAAAVLLCLALGAAGLWLLRTPDGPAANGQDLSGPSDPNPLVERGLENGGSPAPTAPSAPAAPPTTRPAPSTPPAQAVPPTPGAPTPGAPSPGGDPGSSPTQGSPIPAPAPGPGAPSPDPAPPAPAPAPPQVPAAPAPLAFTGITPNQTVGLLGIRILSSYTLSLSGQPRSTASVTYGGAPAGSVTFDGSGRASITVGAGALDLGIGNPMITAAYADGTAGQPIQAHRNSI